MKIKDLKIKIAMALTLVMMGAPAVKAFAAETTTTEDVLSNVSGEQYFGYLRDVFTGKFGTEDKFQKTFEDGTVLEEVNGKTGEVKAIDKGTNKEIYSYNYLKTLDEREKDFEHITTEYMATQEEDSTLDGQEYLGVDEESLSPADLQKQADQIKKEIQNKYGNEDKLKVVSDDGYVKQELNTATGEYKLTDKETNESISYNYYDDLSQVGKEAQTSTDNNANTNTNK